MDVTQITEQPLSSLIANIHVCQQCGIVDRDDDRTRVGHLCGHCGHPSPGGQHYYGLGVDALVDLIQEAFHRPESESRGPLQNTHVGAHHLAVVVLFCTLGEVLLEHFLVECMIAKRLPFEIRRRLLADNLYSRERVSRLFPSLTGVKWRAAVVQLSRERGIDYSATVSFYLRVAGTRNTLVHAGSVWAVPPDVPRDCVRNLPALIELYCSLHNLFVRPLYGGDRPYRPREV